MAVHRISLHGRPAAMVAGLLLAVAAVAFVAPGALAHFGISSSANWSLLRFGRVQEHVVNLTGHWLTAAGRLERSGPILALAGERLVVDYTAAPREGSLRLSLARREPPLFLHGDAVWRHVVDADSRQRVVVELPASGVYELQLWFAAFSGSVEVEWQIE